MAETIERVCVDMTTNTNGTKPLFSFVPLTFLTACRNRNLTSVSGSTVVISEVGTRKGCGRPFPCLNRYSSGHTEMVAV